MRLAEDEVLLPGLVDSHVHLQNPGHSDWEDVGAATRAAAGGGVTTLVDMPVDSEPVTIDAAGRRSPSGQALSGRVFTDVGLWGGVVPGNLGSASASSVAEGVLGFKAFMVSPGLESFPPISLYDLRLALAELVPYHVPLLVHAEDESLALPYTDGGFAEFLASGRPVKSRGLRGRGCSGGDRRPGAHRARVRGRLAGGDRGGPIARRAGDGGDLPALPRPTSLTRKTTPPVRGSVDSEALWRGLADGVLDHGGVRPLTLLASG